MARVTITDVARQAGVSLMTVSRVVNNKDDVSDSTRKKVLQVIEELGYRPSSIARGLVTQRTSTIGVVVPDIDNPFFSGLVRGAENTAYDEEYSVLLCNTNEEPEREIAVLHSLEEKQIDGLLLCSSRLKEADLRNMVNLFPAVVLLSRQLDDDCVGTALIDEVAGGRKLVQHLIQSGHQAIGLISGPSISYSAQMRLQGYCDALQAAGLMYQPDYVRRTSPNIEEGFKTTLQLLKARPEITALVCHNDLVAVGALQACSELGLNVPEDIAVVGYDDIPVASLVSPALTTCRVPLYEFGASAMRLLLDQISECQGSPSEIHPKHVLIQPEMVIRESAP